ncbi:MAG: response regulator [Planctomycetaceae bacterium]
MVAERPRLLVSGDTDEITAEFCRVIGDGIEVVHADGAGPGSPDTSFADAVLFAGQFASRAKDLQVCAQGFMDSVPDALVLVDAEKKVVWHNAVFRSMSGREDSLTGLSFLEALGSPELISPNFSPLENEPGPNQVMSSILKLNDRRFVEFRASRSQLPVGHGQTQPFTSIVLRDVTEEVTGRQKVEAIHKAGIELGNLSPDDVREMSHDQRIDLLKQNILRYTKEILGFETIEIRLLNPATGQLKPLLDVGMQEEAVCRLLFAKETGNGVTGYVAASGQSYLCQDTRSDSLYLTGAAGARSSLTVPLIMHDEVLGTFNVESPGTQSFDQKDLEFLQEFGDVVAVALNQLQLLMAEKFTTATANSQRLRREVARPTDDILYDATSILEKYIGHDPDVCDKLHRILDNTRLIRGNIDKVSEDYNPDTDYGPVVLSLHEERPALKGKRILVADADDSVRESAYNLLFPYGCEVEGIRSGLQACQMARSHHYDVVLADIRLPDMSGYECFCKVRSINEHMPVILMTGFGWDASHSIVKARQQGLKAVLYKPFRMEQLLTEVEKAVTTPPPVE